jgi:hypothetical protein
MNDQDWRFIELPDQRAPRGSPGELAGSLGLHVVEGLEVVDLRCNPGAEGTGVEAVDPPDGRPAGTKAGTKAGTNGRQPDPIAVIRPSPVIQTRRGEPEVGVM